MHTTCPRVFYKYRPANDYTISLLRRHELKFSYGEEYNDPFDSQVNISVEGDVESILHSLEATPIDEDVKQNLRRGITEGKISGEVYGMAAYETTKRTIMSSCFSTQSDNLLLWSHYAESHRGICVGLRNYSSTSIPEIKFNLGNDDSDPDPFKSGVFAVYKVKYTDSGVVEWEPFKDKIEIFMKAHTTKAKCWEYEDEYRLVLPFGEFQSTILNFDPRFLAEVYYGCRIEPGFRKEVQRAVRECYLDKGIDVKVFQMAPSKTRFALDRVEVKM